MNIDLVTGKSLPEFPLDGGPWRALDFIKRFDFSDEMQKRLHFVENVVVYLIGVLSARGSADFKNNRILLRANLRYDVLKNTFLHEARHFEQHMTGNFDSAHYDGIDSLVPQWARTVYNSIPEEVDARIHEDEKHWLTKESLNFEWLISVG